MAALDNTDFADVHLYGYLEAVGQTDKTFTDAGDQLVADLAYWNAADTDASEEKAKTLAWGFVRSCLNNAPAWGTQWKGTASDHGPAISQLVQVMQDSSKLVSDIAAQVDAIFSFTA